MRAVLERRVPQARAVDGTAESIPLDDESVNAVVVGNAFHHFARDDAFAEIGRVLRPGGTLACSGLGCWRSGSCDSRGSRRWTRSSRGPEHRMTSRPRNRTWKEPLASAAGFGPFERREFAATHTIATARIADLYATSSDVASLPAATRTALLDRIRELSRGQAPLLKLAGRTVVDLCCRNEGNDPYR
jgi:SAM-dependent methyltransferase